MHTGLDINDRIFPPNVSLRAELYDGAKLFYLSGLQYGCDAKNAFSTLNESGTHNVGLVLVKKCQHMIWVAGSFTHQNRTKLLYKRMRTGDQSSQRFDRRYHRLEIQNLARFIAVLGSEIQASFRVTIALYCTQL